MPAWFDIYKLDDKMTEGGNKHINRGQCLRNMDIIKEVVDTEVELMGDSKKVVIGGFS